MLKYPIFVVPGKDEIIDLLPAELCLGVEDGLAKSDEHIFFSENSSFACYGTEGTLQRCLYWKDPMAFF